MDTIEYLISILREYASIAVTIFCFITVYIFISIGFQSVIGPVLGGVVGGIAAVIAITFFPNFSWNGYSQHRNPLDYRIPVIVTSLYICSMIVMYRFVLYERPLLHYIVFGGFAGYIAYEIGTGARRIRVVPQILVLTFFTYWSSQFAFPAGAFSPDVQGRGLPAINAGIASGHISLDFSTYLGYFVYVAESSLLTGLTPELAYYLLATAILTGTLLVISIVDTALPQISSKIALYSALLFGCMSWTIGRGLRPNKLNFFYPLILLVGIVALKIFSSSSKYEHFRWGSIGVVVSTALIFGHRFSSGAAMVFLGTIGIFVIVYRTILNKQYTSDPRGFTLGFIGAYILGVFGNPIHTGPLIGRASGLVLSVLAPISTSATQTSASVAQGGPGRYSAFSLEFLLTNTASQALLFALAVFGAALVIRRADWEYDLVIFWMGVLSVLLLFSLVYNARDFQPQRFYALLGLFGLNICAGATLVAVGRINYRSVGPVLVAIAVCLFAIVSLTSPVAGIALSPFSDDIPHYPKYETAQGIEGNEWVNIHTENALRIVGPSSDVEINQKSATSGEVIIRQIPRGSIYSYSDLSKQSGVVVDGGRSIGGRNFVFVYEPATSNDDAVYSNGQYSVYVRN